MLDQLRRKAMLDKLGQPTAGSVTTPEQLGGQNQYAPGYMPPGIQAPVDPTKNPLEVSPVLGQTPGTFPDQTPTSGGTLGTTLGQYANRLEGFDTGKLNSEHNSPKYQFGRVFSKYDPTGGISQAMLDELNGLGLGTVSGKVGGDVLSLGGNVDPRFDGLTQFDVVRDLGQGGWQWGGIGGQRQPQQQQMQGPGITADANQYAQGGDAAARIRAELEALINGRQSPTSREALLAQLGGR